MKRRVALLAVLPWLMSAQGSPPAPEHLIRTAIHARRAQDQKGWKYIYREDHDQSQLDGKERPLTPSRKTYDVIMLEGETYRKLILVDGKPLDVKTQKKVDKDLERTRSARRKRGFRSFTRTVSAGGLDQLERLFNNKVVGEETVIGRKTWRVESEPRQGYKPANKPEEQALSARRVTWFDQLEGVDIKSWEVFFRKAAGFQPGTEIEIERVKVGDAWLIGEMTFRFTMKVMAMIAVRGQSHHRYYDYKRFEVESNFTPQ